MAFRDIKAKVPADSIAPRYSFILRWSLLLVVLLFLTTAPALTQTRSSSPALHFADYDAELRRPDGRVDTDAMVSRLKDLGITKYYWLIWHAATDWDDLKLFLPRAGQEKIETWVYLVPPSEGPTNYPASEPFKLDYLRWAEEIARLSVQHTNLTGWVIDDFYANHQFFTPAYVRQMQTKAKGINGQLAFLPLMYFPEITPQFVNDYNDVIDGVVVAYPQDREEIVHARAVLNGDTSSMPGELSCPWNAATTAGDFVSATIPARVFPTNRVTLRFLERDDFTGPTAGYHFKQVTIDEEVVWEEDVAGGSNGWKTVEADVTRWIQGKTNAILAFRLFDKKGVSNFGVHWRVKDLHATGLEPFATLNEPQQWRVEHRDPFTTGFGKAEQPAKRNVHVPFIVMTAGSADEFLLRHGDPASPERIADWLHMCLDTWRDSQCDGVVTYCLDKTPESQVFPLGKKLFGEFRNR